MAHFSELASKSMRERGGYIGKNRSVEDPPTEDDSASIVIIGGSLCGLTFALACAQRGIRTRVLERVKRQHRAGGAMGVDRALLARATGFDPRNDDGMQSLPVIAGRREATSWYAVQEWLSEQIRGRSEITVLEGLAITEVTQDAGCASAITIDGRLFVAPAIAGADGYRSVVRAAISPSQRYGSYAGYLLWRGLVDEADLPRSTQWPRDDQGGGFVSAEGYRLIAYLVPGRGGSIEPGHRQIGFSWYDPTRDLLLRQRNCLSTTGRVVASLHREDVPARVHDELLNLARNIWPEPWRSAVVHALKKRDVFGTPVAEYFPERLCRDRLAILGDAAHVVSPMTGRGFIAGILDAEALAEALHQSEDGVTVALQSYENQRLAHAQSLAAASMAWSRDYTRSFDELKRLRMVPGRG